MRQGVVMSIRAIALEVYKAQQKVGRLEKKLEAASLAEKDSVRWELQVATREYRQMRRILDGEKVPSPVRSDLSTFKRKK